MSGKKNENNMEENITNNIKAQNQNIEVLKKHFGQCFDKSGNFDFDKFKQELSENEIDFYKESYGMDWLGKSYARVIASDSATTLLKEDEEFNLREENKDSKNLLIKGDNLEVLKHLSNCYYEQINMIYVDPPYNTGKDDFFYQDDRKFTIEDLKKLAGVNEEKASRILEFTQSKSNSHSAWLTFMYPRLYIAKQLLKEDGIIFISIDDNEVSQLRLIMDEIFGEENFVGKIIWKNVTDNNPSNIATEHEYVICYSVNKAKIAPFWKSSLSDIKELLVEKGNELVSNYPDQEELQSQYTKWFRENKNQLGELDRYKYIDKGGIFTGSQSVHNPGKDGYRYDIIHPKTKKPCKQPLMGYRFPQETMDKMIEDGIIIFGEDENKLVEIKVYAKDYTQKLSSVFQLDGRIGANELKELFPSVKKIFTNPKTVKLLQELMAFAGQNNDLTLDFFSGSGTTGDAVMRLNKEDGGNRKFILAQLPEPIDKSKSKPAYEFVKKELGIEEPTIFDITKERLIRSAKRIKETNPDGLDLGFKIFETIPVWEDYGFDSTELSGQTKLFDETKLNEEDLKALLITWKTFDGSPLTEQTTTYDFEGYTGHYVNSKLYLMDKGFSTTNLTKLLEKIDSDKNFNPTSIIAFGYHFDSKNLREISENINSYANKKNIDIDFITRY
ncbi:site-specific DNA-methyltransferase [Snuella lapsa]|uniref:site-specific DNA-methyltransferase (adenine-specific) n=2 Tax=Snuella lapsa TaxID=870481 RepID=A0ABP6X3K2_9FLAO